MSDSIASAPAFQENLPGYSLLQLTLYALRLGTTGFGGPVALVGYMHRDLVETRRGRGYAKSRDNSVVLHVDFDGPTLMRMPPTATVSLFSM